MCNYTNYNPCCPTVTPQIIIGPVGPAGPQGAPGQNVLQYYGSFYSNETATINQNGQDIPIVQIGINNGFTLANNAITVNNAGTYLVNYSIHPSITPAGNAIAGLYVNGINQINSNYQIADDVNLSNSYLVTLNAGDTLSLGAVNGATNSIGLTQQATHPNVNLTLVKIA